MANTQDLRELEKDPRLFLYTSLTAGSSHIITATSRLETILKANKIPFQAIDIATDEQHRKLWQRRAGKKKLPGLVKEGFVIGDLEEVEEWNEYGELKENIGPVPGAGAGAAVAPKSAAASTSTASASVPAPKPLLNPSKMIALPGAAEIKAMNAAKTASVLDEPPKPETMTTAPAEKEKSIEKSIKFKGDVEKQAEGPKVLSSTPAITSMFSEPTTEGEVASDKADAPASSKASKDSTDDATKSSPESDTKITAPEVSKQTKDDILEQVKKAYPDEMSTSKDIVDSITPSTSGKESAESTILDTTPAGQLHNVASKLTSSITEAVNTKSTTANEASAKSSDTSTESTILDTSVVGQLQNIATKVSSTITDVVGTKSTAAEASSGTVSDTTTSKPSVVEQLQDMTNKAISSVKDATATPSTADKASEKPGETATTTTITDQLKDAASKASAAAADAVKGTPLANVIPTTSKPAIDDTEKTVPDAAATSEAVETGEIDEGNGEKLKHNEAPKTSATSSSEAASSVQHESKAEVQDMKSATTTKIDHTTKAVENVKATKDNDLSPPAADPTEATKTVGD